MAEHYRDIIKSALREFDSSHADETYDALSWGGLMGTGSVDPVTGHIDNSTVAWTNLTNQERLDVLALRASFNNSNPDCE